MDTGYFTEYSFYNKHNPTKIQHIDAILQLYEREQDGDEKLWSDFRTQYGGIDPRDYVSQLSQHLISVEAKTHVEILEVMEEIFGMLEKIR